MAIEINGTTGISGVDGSATTPALQGSDSNTGISFGTDEVEINTGGVERVKVDSSGNVGIGVTSPSTALHVKTTDATQLTLERDGTGSQIAAVIFKDGSGDQARISSGESGIVFGTGSLNTDRMRIDANGAVKIGTQGNITQTGANIQVESTNWNIVSRRSVSTSAGHIVFENTNNTVGSIVTNGTATSYSTSSDYRLKENVTAITDGITRVKQLAPKRFNFIADANTTVDGFLAHEAQTVVPEAVTGTHNEVDGDGNPVMQGIDQSKLVPLLTAALQEAIAKIETLEAKVAVLEAAS